MLQAERCNPRSKGMETFDTKDSSQEPGKPLNAEFQAKALMDHWKEWYQEFKDKSDENSRMNHQRFNIFSLFDKELKTKLIWDKDGYGNI